MEENIKENTKWHTNKIGNLLLDDYQIEVLKKNGINLNESINNILMQVNDILMDEDNDELELIASQIDEMNYYQSKKN